jgi:hypothetical protein
VPALVGGALLIGIAVMQHAIVLSRHGGWLSLWRSRSRREEPGDLGWAGLSPIERSYFYLVPIWVAIGSVLVLAAGIVLVL